MQPVGHRNKNNQLLGQMILANAKPPFCWFLCAIPPFLLGDLEFWDDFSKHLHERPLNTYLCSGLVTTYKTTHFQDQTSLRAGKRYPTPTLFFTDFHVV